MAHTSIGGQIVVKNCHFLQFPRKKTPKRYSHPKGGCKSCFYVSYFLTFAFFCPSFSFFLCFFTSQGLKIAHQLRCAAIYIYACSLIWWAVLGFQDVMKQQEIWRNKERKTKKLRKKKPKTQQKPPRFCGGFCWPILTIKLGIFKEFGHLCAHQSRLQPYVYIYIYPDGLIRGPIFCTPEGW